MVNLFLPFLYQIININSTVPCFLNKTAGWHILENCGFKRDFLTASILPWQWLTGGYISFVLVTLLILIVYLKYHKALPAILIGVLYLPFSYFLFPSQFLIFGILFAFIAIGISIWFTFIKQSND